MGDVVRQADARDSRRAACATASSSRCCSSSSQAADVRADVHDADRRRARDGRPARRTIFQFFQRLRLRYYDRTPVGRLVTRATNDVDAVERALRLGRAQRDGRRHRARRASSSMMLALDWRLSLVSFLALPLVGLIVNFVRKRSREAYRDVRARTARLNAFLNEQVNGIAVVQAFVREARDGRRVRRDQRRLPRRQQARHLLRGASSTRRSRWSSTLCIASILWFAGLPPRRRPRDHVRAARHLHAVHPAVLRAGEPALAALHAPPERDGRAPSASSSSSTRRTSRRRALAAERRAAPDGPGRRGHRARARRLRVQAGRPGPARREPRRAARREDRARGRDRRRQDDGREPAPAPLRAAGRRRARARARTCAATSRTRSARSFSVVPQDVFLFAGTVLSNVAMSDADARPRAGRGRAASHRRARALRARATGGPRRAGRRARAELQRRRAPAPRLRARDLPRRAAPRPRRGDGERRLGHRGAPAARARGGHARGARRSSSPTACRRSARPTASSCSTRGASSRSGTHDELMAQGRRLRAPLPHAVRARAGRGRRAARARRVRRRRRRVGVSGARLERDRVGARDVFD